jgi:hypothetical protein
MARILSSTRYAYSRSTAAVDVRRLLFTAFQVCVLAGIALFLVLAIVNSILGAPQPDPVYAPFD